MWKSGGLAHGSRVRCTPRLAHWRFRTDIQCRGHGGRKLRCTITTEPELPARMSHHDDARHPTEFSPDTSDVAGTHVELLRVVVDESVGSVRHERYSAARNENRAPDPHPAARLRETIDGGKRCDRQQACGCSVGDECVCQLSDAGRPHGQLDTAIAMCE